MIVVKNVQELIAKYVLGNMDVEAFGTQFSELFYDIEKTGETDAVKLSYAVQSKLADFSVNAASEASLKNFLQGMIPSNSPIQSTWALLPCVACAFPTEPVYYYQPVNEWVPVAGRGTQAVAASFGRSPGTGFWSNVPSPQVHQSSKVPLQ